MHLLQQRLEVDLIVLVARGHRERDGELGVGAARSVDAVPEDETSPTSPDAGVWVASPVSIVHRSPAEGFDVGAVDGQHSADEGS